MERFETGSIETTKPQLHADFKGHKEYETAGRYRVVQYLRQHIYNDPL
jgi:hypothetical protein